MSIKASHMGVVQSDNNFFIGTKIGDIDEKKKHVLHMFYDKVKVGVYLTLEYLPRQFWQKLVKITFSPEIKGVNY